jgi:Holliday junction resolvase RusA-like endonuclease
VIPTVVTLPLCPSTNHLFAGDGRRRYKTKEYAAWIEEAGYALNRQKPEPIRGKVRLLIEVEEPKMAIAQDVTNRIKASEDILVRHGIIEGDDQRFVRSVTAEWSRHVVGIRITVTPLE